MCQLKESFFPLNMLIRPGNCEQDINSLKAPNKFLTNVYTIAQYKLYLHNSIMQNCAIFISTNLYMLWKPQNLWEEEDALEKNPGLTGHWLLKWYRNHGVR